MEPQNPHYAPRDSGLIRLCHVVLGILIVSQHIFLPPEPWSLNFYVVFV